MAVRKKEMEMAWPYGSVNGVDGIDPWEGEGGVAMLLSKKKNTRTRRKK